MTVQENKRLQLLFEDSMSTLTSSVEGLSQTLTNEVAALGVAAREAVAENDPGAAAAQSIKRAKACVLTFDPAFNSDPTLGCVLGCVPSSLRCHVQIDAAAAPPEAGTDASRLKIINIAVAVCTLLGNTSL